jgi:glucose uptake protein
MWLPENYPQALLMLLISMLCWGSWANALKLMKNCRFELFYWDYVFGTTAASIILGLTLGSTGGHGASFFQDIHAASITSILFAFAGGVAFNVSNILLTAAIEVAGMAVAFPTGVGLSIIIGVLLSYVVTPKNDPVLLFGGVVLLLVAIVMDARAYGAMMGAAKRTTRRGVVLCIVSGVGLGLFYPLVAKSFNSPQPLGPYAVAVFFMLGMLASNLIVNTLIMIRPVTGQSPIPLSSYWKMPVRWHWIGLTLGGALWGTGTVLNFVTSGTGIVGPATSFALGDGATMVAALWGILAWREFDGASPSVKRLLLWMFVLFALGLAAIAISPVVSLIK